MTSIIGILTVAYPCEVDDTLIEKLSRTYQEYFDRTFTEEDHNSIINFAKSKNISQGFSRLVF